MPKQETDRLTFVGGLVSDANPTLATADTCKELTNFTLNKDGSIETRYRLGLDLTLARDNTLSSPIKDVKSYLWEKALPDGTDVLVRAERLEGGGTDDSDETLISFYNAATGALIAAWETDNLGNPFDSWVDDFTTIQGYLVIIFGGTLAIRDQADLGTFYRTNTLDQVYGTPGLATFSADENVIELLDSGSLFIRNFNNTFWRQHGDWGQVWANGNAGWTVKSQTDYYTQVGSWPTEEKIPQLGVDSAGAFSATLLNGQQFTGGSSLRGSLIGNPFTQTNDLRFIPNGEPTPTPTGYDPTLLWDLAADGATLSRVKSVVSYAGRLWYLCIAGKADTRLTQVGNAFLLYSQVIEEVADARKCHTKNDPANPFINQTLPTDGGYIPLSDKGVPFRLAVTGNDLAIFTTAGIYTLDADGYFDPTRGNFNLRPLSESITAAYDNEVTETQFYFSSAQELIDYTCTNTVNVDDSLFFLSPGGVQMLARRDQTDTYVLQPVSEGRLNRYFSKIPPGHLGRATGLYNAPANTISWVFADDEVVSAGGTPWTPTDGVNGLVAPKYSYNTMLNFNLSTNTFSLYRFGDQEADGGIEYFPEFAYITTNTTPTLGDDLTRTDSSAITFVTHRKSDIKAIYTARFNTTGTIAYGSDYLDIDGTEFIADTDSSYNCVVETNEYNLSDTKRRKTGLNLTLSFSRAEQETDSNGNFLLEGSCMGKILWDYSPTVTSNGAITNNYQLYRLSKHIGVGSSESYDYGQDVLTTRTKFRGRGRSARIRLEGESGKLTHIYSYGFEMNVKDTPSK